VNFLFWFYLCGNTVGVTNPPLQASNNFHFPFQVPPFLGLLLITSSSFFSVYCRSPPASFFFPQLHPFFRAVSKSLFGSPIFLILLTPFLSRHAGGFFFFSISPTSGFVGSVPAVFFLFCPSIFVRPIFAFAFFFFQVPPVFFRDRKVSCPPLHAHYNQPFSPPSRIFSLHFF